VGGAAHADQTPRCHRPVGRGCDGTSRVDLACGGVDDGADGPRAVEVEKVAWGVDLGVIVIRRAGATETTSTDEDGGVWEEDRSGVVVAGDGDGGSLDEVGGRSDKDLGCVLGCIVRERLPVNLAADDENIAVWHDDAVGEYALGVHAVDRSHCWCLTLIGEGDDVCIGRGIHVLVAGSTASDQDFACNSIVHGSNTAHSVAIVSTVSRSLLATGSVGVIPVHRLAGTGLEDPSLLPAKEHGVVVGTVDALCVVGQHGSDRATWETGPGVLGNAVDLSVLPTSTTGPTSTDEECTTVGKSTLGGVPTRNLRQGAGRP